MPDRLCDNMIRKIEPADISRYLKKNRGKTKLVLFSAIFFIPLITQSGLNHTINNEIVSEKFVLFLVVIVWLL